MLCFFFSSFFFLFSFLCDSWLGNGSSCFLEVVALSAGEKGGAYGSQDSHQMVSAQRKKETQTRENQRHRAVFVESAYIRVVSSVQNIVSYGCSFFPYFLIPATPKEQ